MSRRRRHSPRRTTRRAVAAGGETVAAPRALRSAGRARIAGIDALRGGAILAMIGYHFAFDLNWFGVFRADFNNDAFWLTLRSLIVSSFLLLVGVSLTLAQRAGIGSGRFWRRIALIAVCALLVTAGSYLAFPKTFITFGILHCIAVSSVIVWPLARYPAPALLGGFAVVATGALIRSQAFDAPWLNWVGMMTYKPPTEDYVPLFPWTGVVLVGIGVGGWLASRDYRPLEPLSRAAPRWLTWLGKHSLFVYMVHQPVLLGMLRVLLPR